MAADEQDSLNNQDTLHLQRLHVEPLLCDSRIYIDLDKHASVSTWKQWYHLAFVDHYLNVILIGKLLRERPAHSEMSTSEVEVVYSL